MLDTIRHFSVFSPDKHEDQEFHVIGAGATGSKVVMELAKLGLKNIHVWDYDEVESHNIPNQLFGNQHIGMKKVDALKEVVEQFTGISIITHDQRVTGEEEDLTGVIFLLTDTMASRKEIWENAIRFKINVDVMIETRMGADNGRIYTINPVNPAQVSMWESTLVDDDVAEESACGASVSVGPTASILAGYAVWQYIRWADIKCGGDDDQETEIIFSLRSSFIMAKSA
jgi:molybdopterin/thiamine biosynthesis adenylyltransferase